MFLIISPVYLTGADQNEYSFISSRTIFIIYQQFGKKISSISNRGDFLAFSRLT